MILERSFTEWLNQARQWSQTIWGYRELPDDDPDTTLAAFTAGEDPQTFILELGEDLELHKATKYWLGGYGI